MDNINSPPSNGFKPGHSGNLAGRPKSLDVRRRNAVTASLAAWERLVERSLDGDIDAAVAVMEHLRGVLGAHNGPQTAEAASRAQSTVTTGEAIS
jgi:hypothetical protein